MRIPEFRMERMQSTWEHVVEHDLSESGVRPLTAEELFADDPDALQRALRAPLGYAQGNGHLALRDAIAAFYPGATTDDVCVTTGTSEANLLSLMALVEPGDRVVIVLPAYMQVHGWAQGLGAQVVPVWLEESRGWQFDPDALRRAARGAKVVYVCDPGNPTGAVMSDENRRALREVVAERGPWLVADQVYRGAERAAPLTPSLFDPDMSVVVTAGLSKAFGLPGLRVGWVVSQPSMVNTIWSYHDYTTIAPTTLSAAFAEHALARRERLLARTRAILRENWPILEAWAQAQAFRYVSPAAGAIAFFRAALPMPASAFVDRLIRERSTMIVPGDHFLMGDGYDRGTSRSDVASRRGGAARRRSYLRIGFGMTPAQLEAGLARVAELLQAVRVPL